MPAAYPPPLAIPPKTAGNRFFFLQRYDIWPALISLLAIWLFCSRRFALCGVAIAAGIGVKLYPVVFVPPLFILAMREGKWRSFLSGLVVGLLPIGALSFLVPWWKFLQFHASRGLQVESLYASALWLGNLLGLAPIDWAWTNKWFEVRGTLASAVLPWARGLFAVALAISTVAAVWAASTIVKPSLAQIARILLVPLLGFLTFNPVLSPQYMIWLLPLAALGSMEDKPWTVYGLAFATVLTPIFFPTPEYLTGLNFVQAVVLFSRNVVLVVVWILLLKECLIACKPSENVKRNDSGIAATD